MAPAGARAARAAAAVTRVYVDRPIEPGEVIELPAPAAHHVCTVLRLGAGESIAVFNGRGGEYRGRLEAAGHRRVTVRIDRFDPAERESPLAITVVQAVSRAERMDYTIQKAVELGAARIVPLATRRIVVRLDAARRERRLEHWRGIIIQACEQCGRNRLPRLDDVHDLEQWVRADTGVARYLLDPAGARSLAAEPTPGGPVTLVAGAEGGFEKDEVECLRRAGYRAVALGPRILRTETAAVTALVVLQSRWGDLA